MSGRAFRGFPRRAWRRGGYALVDRKSLSQARGTLFSGAFLEVCVAESFQGACFLCGRADIAGDGLRLGVMLAGLAGG
jgi:hypothetical protein